VSIRQVQLSFVPFLSLQVLVLSWVQILRVIFVVRAMGSHYWIRSWWFLGMMHDRIVRSLTRQHGLVMFRLSCVLLRLGWYIPCVDVRLWEHHHQRPWKQQLQHLCLSQVLILLVIFAERDTILLFLILSWWSQERMRLQHVLSFAMVPWMVMSQLSCVLSPLHLWDLYVVVLQLRSMHPWNQQKL